jgi:Flp pilus assembly protein TadD
LDAYTRAEALMPSDAPQEMVARLYSYRGAIYKRLGRLDDALRDLRIADRLAQTSYEILDVTYNLACVLTMRGEVEKALQYLRKLKQLGGLGLVNAHIDDYFVNLHSAPEFWDLLGINGTSGEDRRL